MQELLSRFYEALARQDAEGMIACYHTDSAFSDPVFPRLNHDETAAMWRMLLGRAKDFSFTFQVIGEDRVDWTARYLFSKTGRIIVNEGCSQFGFRDGLILAQRDGFDFPRWLRQARLEGRALRPHPLDASRRAQRSPQEPRCVHGEGPLNELKTV